MGGQLGRDNEGMNMNSEWRDMAAYVVRLERERDELRAALRILADVADSAAITYNIGTMDVWIDKARAALSSGAGTEGGQ